MHVGENQKAQPPDTSISTVTTTTTTTNNTTTCCSSTTTISSQLNNATTTTSTLNIEQSMLGADWEKVESSEAGHNSDNYANTECVGNASVQQQQYALKNSSQDSRDSEQKKDTDKVVEQPGNEELQQKDNISKKMKIEPRIFKIIVIGDSNVGKTCLTYRFCEGKFPSKVEATIGVDFREKAVTIREDTLKLQLWDTAGQERFRKSMVPHYYRNVHAVVYVYDMTKRSTFDSLSDWLGEYSRFSLNQEVPRILVGNKCDMVDLLQVSTNEAQCFADRHQMPLFETSAKDDSKTDHVDSIFMTLAHKLKDSKPMMGQRYGLSEELTNSMKPVKVVQYTTIGQPASPTKCSC